MTIHSSRGRSVLLWSARIQWPALTRSTRQAGAIRRPSAPRAGTNGKCATAYPSTYPRWDALLLVQKLGGIAIIKVRPSYVPHYNSLRVPFYRHAFVNIVELRVVDETMVF
jgi:hypothetical protein